MRDSTPDLTHVRAMWEDDGASRRLGIEIIDLGVEEGPDGQLLGHARTRMRLTDFMVNGHRIAHGGYVFTFCDSTFALACNATGRLTVASGCDITYVAPSYEGETLLAQARERAVFGRSGITDVTVTRESDGALIAEFRGRSRALRPGAGAG